MVVMISIMNEGESIFRPYEYSIPLSGKVAFNNQQISLPIQYRIVGLFLVDYRRIMEG
jgi:hypothetical protein